MGPEGASEVSIPVRLLRRNWSQSMAKAWISAGKGDLFSAVSADENQVIWKKDMVRLSGTLW